MTLISYLAVAIILLAYISGSPTAFNIANACLFMFVAYPSIKKRVWPPVIINVAFGLIAIYNLL